MNCEEVVVNLLLAVNEQLKKEQEERRAEKVKYENRIRELVEEVDTITDDLAFLENVLRPVVKTYNGTRAFECAMVGDWSEQGRENIERLKQIFGVEE